MAQTVKSLPVMQETWVWSLSQEDPLEKEMATQSSILAWKIPWTEEPGQLQSMGHKESDTTEWLHFHFWLTLLAAAGGGLADLPRGFLHYGDFYSPGQGAM